MNYLLLDERERAQRRVPDHEETDYTETATALRTLFSGKCAFCETRTSIRTYRFRPTHDAEPLADSLLGHACYAWLSDAWQNLYPICSECSPDNPLYFPVEKDRTPVPTPEEYRVYMNSNTGIWPHSDFPEQPTLLDPCSDRDLDAHFRITRSGVIEAVSKRGEQTMWHFNLNRGKLIERREGVFREYEGQADVSVDREYAGLWKILKSGERVYGRRRGGSSFQSRPVHVPASLGEDNAGRLKRVEFENFKSLQRLVLDMPDLPPDPTRQAQAMVLLGDNSAGKSSVLEAIALALIPADARKAMVPVPSSLRLEPSYLGGAAAANRPSAKVVLTFDSGNEVTLTSDDNGLHVQGRARVPVFAYGAYRHYLGGVRKKSSHVTVVSLFKSDTLLSNPEKWLLRLPEPKFRMVVQALREIFGSSLSFSVIDRDQAAKKCYLLHEADGANPGRTPLDLVSSGFRTILALACDIMRWTTDDKINPSFQSLLSARGIVMIDEVEAHLHPRWKIQVMEGLRRALPGMTFIVTTHDPLCLRGMRGDEVRVLRRVRTTAPNSYPIKVEALADVPSVPELTIEQLLTSDVFGLLSTDDPKTERKLALLADYLFRVENGMEVDAAADAAMRELRTEIAANLPVGMGEAARLIQDEVAKFLVSRKAADAIRTGFKDATRRKIRQVLESF